MKTKVVHCKHHKYDVYIGRPSMWGNPFAIGKDGTRAEVITKYEEYLTANSELMSKVKQLQGMVLGCWCASGKEELTASDPLVCHGQILAKYADA